MLIFHTVMSVVNDYYYCMTWITWSDSAAKLDCVPLVDLEFWSVNTDILWHFLTNKRN